MSTRWYPLYQRGNPQLRVFLPNFWMKLIKPKYRQPENVVQFACSMQMTCLDVRQYLEKIYKIPVVEVRTRIALGKFKRVTGKGYINKEDDVKLAYVVLPLGEKFEFPDIFPEKEAEKRDDEKSLDETKLVFRKYLDKSKDRPGLPGWFSL